MSGFRYFRYFRYFMFGCSLCRFRLNLLSATRTWLGFNIYRLDGHKWCETLISPQWSSCLLTCHKIYSFQQHFSNPQGEISQSNFAITPVNVFKKSCHLNLKYSWKDKIKGRPLYLLSYSCQFPGGCVGGLLYIKKIK